MDIKLENSIEIKWKKLDNKLKQIILSNNIALIPVDRNLKNFYIESDKIKDPDKFIKYYENFESHSIMMLKDFCRKFFKYKYIIFK